MPAAFVRIGKFVLVGENGQQRRGIFDSQRIYSGKLCQNFIKQCDFNGIQKHAFLCVYGNDHTAGASIHRGISALPQGYEGEERFQFLFFPDDVRQRGHDSHLYRGKGTEYVKHCLGDDHSGMRQCVQRHRHTHVHAVPPLGDAGSRHARRMRKYSYFSHDRSSALPCDHRRHAPVCYRRLLERVFQFSALYHQ